MKSLSLTLPALLLAAIYFTGSQAVDSLRMFIIGDWGGVPTPPYSTLFERSTADEMGKMADRFGPKYIFALGDNFYFTGVKNLEDPRFKATYESVYTAKSLQVPWYLVAGNHDHNGNVSAQIQYSGVSERWNFPDYYYYKEFPIDSDGHTVGLVMIDTVQLCGNSDHDVLGLQPKGPLDVSSAEKQWDFIEKSLNASKADYLFVAGHYPIYSIAEHGPTKCLTDRLQPMIEKYNANGYLCGHDHNLQHLTVTKNNQPLHYFVTGMANFIDAKTTHEDKVPKGSLKFHNADVHALGGFLYSEATASNMTMSFISAAGKTLYGTTVQPRKRL